MNKTKMRLKEIHDTKAPNYDVDFLETLLYEWVRRSINLKNFHLTNKAIKTAAIRFKAILNLKSFNATDEWLQKFRMTYLKDVNKKKLDEISKKCRKSKNIFWNIFNELLPKWQSLDPKPVNAQIAKLDSRPSEDNEIIVIRDEDPDVKIIDVKIKDIKEIVNVQESPQREDETTSINEIDLNTNDANSTEFFDIEDELPVCTIFGRKTVQNVANIISSGTKSDDDKFQPMIVCTDPNNPNLDSIDKSTKDHTFFNSTNKAEVEKIRDLINGKLIDTDSNTSSQTEYIDQYLKELVRVPDDDKTKYPRSSTKFKPKTTTDKKIVVTPIFKRISMSKLKAKKTKPNYPQNLKQLSDLSSETIDTETLESNKEPLTKPNRKRKNKQNLSELTKNVNLETKGDNQDRDSTLKPLSLFDSTSLPAETVISLQAQDLNQIPAVVQQAALPPNITTNFIGETIPDTQSSLVAPGRIMYTFQMASAPNQNQIAMPYISPVTTNFQTTQFGQPMVLHFHSPMALQTTDILPGSEIMSSALMNLTQTPSISQASFIPSMDLTQQTTSPNFGNFIQNQFTLPTTTTYVQQSLSTAQTSAILTTPTMSTTPIQQTPILGVIPSNSTLTITPTSNVPKVTPPTKVKPTKTKTKPTQPPVSIKSKTITSTITSFTSNSTTSSLPNLVPSKIIPITTTLIQPTVSTQTPIFTTSNLNSSIQTPTSCFPTYVPKKNIPTTTTSFQPLLSTKSTTITSKPSTTNSVQNMPISITNSTPSSKATTSMQVTITKKSRLTTDPSSKKGTRFAQRTPLKTHEEVIKCIKLMEDFAMMNENFRLIGFLERLEQEIYLNKTK